MAAPVNPGEERRGKRAGSPASRSRPRYGGGVFGDGWSPPDRWSRLVDWLVLPVTGFAAWVLPAADAHLRLLLGQRLEYQVTEKLAPSLPPTSAIPSQVVVDEVLGR